MSLIRRLSRSTTRQPATSSTSLQGGSTGSSSSSSSSSINSLLTTATTTTTIINTAAEYITDMMDGYNLHTSADTSLTSSTNNILQQQQHQHHQQQLEQDSVMSYSTLSHEMGDRELTIDELNTPPPPPPKHIPFPDVPQNSELLNELLMFAYALLAAAMQFLHLYRSVWWLPESHSKQAVNLYLIDTQLATFILILFVRRIAFCTTAKLIDLICPRFIHRFIMRIIRLIFFFGCLALLGTCCCTIFTKHSWNVIYLCYPIVVYFITFGFRLEPFLRTNFDCRKATYLNGSPLHCCTTNATTIRHEIDSLKCDCYSRFKQVVFTTILNSYYIGFIPCCFAQSYLYYDIFWATQHLAFVVIGGFTMCTIFCFPANYCDVLHRAILHLGQWQRLEPGKYSTTHAATITEWSNQIIYSPGTIVRYRKGELFKAVGIVTTAIPANTIHHRFYLFFQNPANIYSTLTITQVLLILLQLTILFFIFEWHNVISLGFLILANYHTLFKIIRDYFVTHKIYAAESSIYDKMGVNGCVPNGGSTINDGEIRNNNGVNSGATTESSTTVNNANNTLRLIN